MSAHKIERLITALRESVQQDVPMPANYIGGYLTGTLLGGGSEVSDAERRALALELGEELERWVRAVARHKRSSVGARRRPPTRRAMKPFETIGTEAQRLIPYQRVHQAIWIDRLTWGALDATDYSPAGSTLRLETDRDGEPYYFGATSMVSRQAWR